MHILSFLPLSLLCFAVALNFQSLAKPMDLNDGRFKDNGGCGYVLKPAVLMSSQGHFDPSRSQRRVRPIQLLLKVGLRSTEEPQLSGFKMEPCVPGLGESLVSNVSMPVASGLLLDVSV